MSSEVTLDYLGRKVSGQKVGFDIGDKENWSSYILEDGTKIRMRLVVAEIVRLKGEYNQDGEPIYIVKSTNVVTTTDVPEHLKKKISGSGSGKMN